MLTIGKLVAGGGGGGSKGQEDVQGAGGGAGGFRTNLILGPAPGGFPISASPYPISVGGGGAGGPNTPGPSGSPTRQGSAGSVIQFLMSITSAGGGRRRTFSGTTWWSSNACDLEETGGWRWRWRWSN
jgi:hypothetical protein